MGYWCTVHLFDDRKFYADVVPELKGEKGDLWAACVDFAKGPGTSRLTDSEAGKMAQYYADRFIKIANSFDQTFKIHSAFAKFDDYDLRREYVSDLDGYYDFCKFFEYYVFRTCADFFPHVPLGKSGVRRNFNLDVNTLSYSALIDFDGWNEFFSGDGTGITNWMTNEDLELLYLDKENLRSDNNEHAEGFLTLLETAHKYRLGLIAGVDMRENWLELLPQHKLTDAEFWQKTNQAGILFKR